MADEMKGLLLEDRWAPITSELGFLETSAAHAVRVFTAWLSGLQDDRGTTVQMRPVSGSLEQVLSSLLPLTNVERRRHLFIPTRSSWTAYLDNGWDGADVSTRLPHMARTLGCKGMRVVAVPHTLHGDKGRYGAVMLSVYSPNQTGPTCLRTLAAINDGGRWVFDSSGEPFPFEQPERYQARKVRDRFTFDMLKDYLHHLGLAPFDENFYLPEGQPAWLVEKTGPVYPHHQEFTLAQVREDF
jgi:hypothetical protein